MQITFALGLWAAFRISTLFGLPDSERLLLICALTFMPIFYQFSICFHYEIMVLLFFLLFAAGLRIRSPLIAAAGWLLLILTKEDMGIFLSLFAVYLITDRTMRSYGIVILIASVCAFFLISRVYMPWASGEVHSRFLSYWGAASLKDLILSLTPQRVLNAWAEWPIVVSILGQTAFLPLLRLRFSAIVLFPIFTIHLLSTHPFFHFLDVYYTYTVIPFLLFGILEATERLRKIPRLAAAAPLALLVAAAAWTAAARKEVPMTVLPDPKPGREIRALLSQMKPGRVLWTHAFLSAQSPLANPVFPLLHKTPPDYILIEPGRTSAQGESAEDVKKALEIARKGCVVGTAQGATLYEMSQELTPAQREKPCTRG